MQILFDERSDSFDLRNLDAVEMVLIHDALLIWYKSLGVTPKTPLITAMVSQREAMRAAYRRMITKKNQEESELG